MAFTTAFAIHSLIIMSVNSQPTRKNPPNHLVTRVTEGVEEVAAEKVPEEAEQQQQQQSGTAGNCA
jgi:hypothetical protein